MGDIEWTLLLRWKCLHIRHQVNITNDLKTDTTTSIMFHGQLVRVRYEVNTHSIHVLKRDNGMYKTQNLSRCENYN